MQTIGRWAAISSSTPLMQPLHLASVSGQAGEVIGAPRLLKNATAKSPYIAICYIAPTWPLGAILHAWAIFCIFEI